MISYPLKTYLEKLRLWLRTTDVAPHAIGPTIVGRLKGAAYRICMKIRLVRQNGDILLADEALAAMAEPEDMNQGLPATTSGLEAMIQTLKDAYGEEEQMLDGPVVYKDAALRGTSAWTNTFQERDHHAKQRGSK